MLQDQEESENVTVSSGVYTENKSFFRRFRFFIIGLLVILVLGTVVVLIGFGVRGKNQSLIDSYQKAANVLDDYKSVMRRDIYGGKTSQETLDLFLTALRNGDMALASKYFSLGTSGEDYLNRTKWEVGLKEVEREGRVQNIIALVSQAIPTKNQSRDLANVFWYSIYDAEGHVVQDIEFVFNSYSGVWKLESL